MKFWKEHTGLRMSLIAIFFLLGMGLVFSGWKMKGELLGLGIMILGLIFLLAALLIYNKAYEDSKNR